MGMGMHSFNQKVVIGLLGRLVRLVIDYREFGNRTIIKSHDDFLQTEMMVRC